MRLPPMAATASDILAALDPDQAQAAQAVHGAVRILAGAGAGKTRTITHRIAYAVATGQQRAETGLAVTFTAKAAGEMRHRLAQLGVAGLPAMTFHAAALRQLRHFWPQAVGGPVPQLLTTKAPVVAEVAAALKLPRDRATVRDLAAEFEWAKVSRVSAQDYPKRAALARRSMPGGLTEQEIAAAYRHYLDLLADRGLMDFEDVLVLTVGLLSDRPDLADQVRSRYRWFTVDEFQDVSPLQSALLDVWLGDGEQICVVGDPGQTIYTFAGASADFLTEFPNRFPRATTVPLRRTYRCSPEIVTAANRLLSHGLKAHQHPPLRLQSEQPAGPEVRILRFSDDLAEAAAVARQAGDWVSQGFAARDVAILVRTNAATAPIEDALAEAGVPYTVLGGDRFFGRSEVREAITRLRGAANAPTQDLALPDQVAEVLAAMNFAAADPPAGRGAVRDRWESLAAISALAADLARSSATLVDFVAELDRRAALEAAPSPDGVTVTTLHAAKGLEWPAVWIAGVQEGTLPISYADSPQRVEEERRLLYVGVTRAARELVLSWSGGRAADARGHRRGSRFLADLTVPGKTQVADVEYVAGGPARQRRKKSTKLGSCRICGRGLPTAVERTQRRCRSCPASIDPDLFDRLRSWRLEQVAQSGAPAYTVFTDATLQAIAELKPRTSSELLAINGIGPAKLHKHGDELLALIRAAD